MPKPKTHKGWNKRVKITATGKVKHWRSCGSHLMSGKNARRRRRIRSSSILTSSAAKTAKSQLAVRRA